MKNVYNLSGSHLNKNVFAVSWLRTAMGFPTYIQNRLNHTIGIVKKPALT